LSSLLGSGLSSFEYFQQIGSCWDSKFVVFDIRNFPVYSGLEKKSCGRLCCIVQEKKQESRFGFVVRRALSREVRHIIRQKGSLIEEIIAIRNGRLVKYVKKDSRGAVTCGSYRMAANKQVTEQKEKVEGVESKEGLLDAILKVMLPVKKQDKSRMKDEKKDDK